MALRVVLGCSLGGLGHLTPVVAVARALASLGHDAVVLVPPSLSEAAAETGLVFPLGGEPPRAVVDEMWERVRTAGARLPDWWSGDRRPLVYVTFGSVLGHLPEARTVYRTALDAVADLPARVLMTVGRAFDPAVLSPIPSNARIEPWVAQADVFRHARLVVCHGGSGTTFGALAAGGATGHLPAIRRPVCECSACAGRRSGPSSSRPAGVSPAESVASERLTSLHSVKPSRRFSATHVTHTHMPPEHWPRR